MSYVLDTSVISAFAPGKPPVPQALSHWIRSTQASLFIPAIGVAEIQQGICKLRRAGATVRADSLGAWLDELLSTFADHILALDAEIARRTGVLSDAVMAAGHTIGLADLMIAATGSVHRLVVLTRNLKHFTPVTLVDTGLRCIDPFIDLPDAIS